MTKMFDGMSKAIDSDAERKFFMDSQAGLGLYPSTNRDILKDQLEALGEVEDKLKNKKVEMSSIKKPEELKKESRQKSPENRVRVRRKKDGKVITMSADKASKYLSDERFERVE
jgi:hypothetical protein